MKRFTAVLLTVLGLNTFAATTPREAYEMSQRGKAVLVDVREADEIKDGMINNAKWFPLSKIQNDRNWKKEFVAMAGEKKIFLYCRTGNRSGQVKSLLKDHNIQSENIGGYLTLKDELPSTRP